MTEFQSEPQLLVLGGVLLAFLIWMSQRWCRLLPVQEYDAEAEGRAIALLHELLSKREREQLAQAGYLVVPSTGIAGREYRVPARPGWVDVYEAGRLAMRVCVEPVKRLPAADVVLMHKLMIEGNEREYLREANIVYVRPPAGRKSRLGL